MLPKLSITTRYVAVVLFITVRTFSYGVQARYSPELVQLGIHSLLRFTHEDYSRATSLSNIASKVHLTSGSFDSLETVPEYFVPHQNGTTVNVRRANATLLMLARNSDVDSALRSVRELEDRFNRKFHYPWVFLNEVPFSSEFKKYVMCLLAVVLGQCVGVPPDQW